MNTFRPFAKLAAVLAALLPVAAFAGTSGPSPIPEPGTWALVALAGVIGVVVARSKRK
jgi:PEP-CTERM motif